MWVLDGNTLPMSCPLASVFFCFLPTSCCTINAALQCAVLFPEICQCIYFVFFCGMTV